jgi:hypothetical protein
MSDGRHFTDYRPNCEMVQLIRADNNLNNSYQFRLFLQSNGDALANIDRKNACLKNCCTPCVEPFEGGTMLPEAYLVACDGRSCTRNLVNAAGLGDGRVYYSAPPSCPDFPKQFPNSPQVSNNCMAPLDKFAYFGEWVPQDMMRVSIPAGGKVMSGGDTRVVSL